MIERQVSNLGVGLIPLVRSADLEDEERLLDPAEAAALLKVRVSWVQDAARDGRLPCVPLGKHRRFRRSSLLAWVAEREVQPSRFA